MIIEDIKHILRAQAWARVKGDLEAVLVTYHGEQAKLEAMEQITTEYIERVEAAGWAE